MFSEHEKAAERLWRRVCVELLGREPDMNIDRPAVRMLTCYGQYCSDQSVQHLKRSEVAANYRPTPRPVECNLGE